jgi:hypothetical protein
MKLFLVPFFSLLGPNIFLNSLLPTLSTDIYIKHEFNTIRFNLVPMCDLQSIFNTLKHEFHANIFKN